MFVSWLRWVGKSRLRTLACLALFASLTLTFFFWVDLCLWRAESNLVQRNQTAAATWIKRSFWFRRKNDRQTCLLQIRLARRQGDFHEVEVKLKQAAKLGVAPSAIQRERWLAMAQTNQFDSMQKHWPELLRDTRDDEPEIARAHYTWAFLNHQVETAFKTLELWHQDYPRDPEPLILIGRLHQSFFDWEGEENAYRQAYAIAPANDEIKLALAKPCACD